MLGFLHPYIAWFGLPCSTAPVVGGLVGAAVVAVLLTGMVLVVRYRRELRGRRFDVDLESNLEGAPALTTTTAGVQLSNVILWDDQNLFRARRIPSDSIGADSAPVDAMEWFDDM